MKTRHIIPIAVATLSLAFAAGCEKRADQESTTSTRSTDTTVTPTGETTTTGATSTSLSNQDKDFAATAAKSGIAEVRMGQIAAKQGALPEVKSFGSRMVTDHSKANSDLQALATKKGVTLPNDLDKDQKDWIDKLGKLSGPKFDKEYADHMVDDHEKDLKAFQKEVDDGKDPDVKQFAAQLVPTLTQHLQAAKDMQIAERSKEGKAKTR